MELLKAWGLVDASRGRRAVVLEVPSGEEQGKTAPPESANGPTEPDGTIHLELTLMFLGKAVRTFTSEADPGDIRQLRRLLLNAV